MTIPQDKERLKTEGLEALVLLERWRAARRQCAPYTADYFKATGAIVALEQLADAVSLRLTSQEGARP